MVTKEGTIMNHEAFSMGKPTHYRLMPIFLNIVQHNPQSNKKAMFQGYGFCLKFQEQP